MRLVARHTSRSRRAETSAFLKNVCSRREQVSLTPEPVPSYCAPSSICSRCYRVLSQKCSCVAWVQLVPSSLVLVFLLLALCIISLRETTFSLFHSLLSATQCSKSTVTRTSFYPRTILLYTHTHTTYSSGNVPRNHDLFSCCYTYSLL